MIKQTLFLLLCIQMTACSDTGISSSIPSTNNGNSAIDQELDKASELNATSAGFSVNQAQNAYFQITGDLLQVPLSVSAFERLNAEVLPPMLAASNSLSGTDSDDTARQEYQRLFNDISAQVLRGINNNLSLYQGLFEANQILDGSVNPPAETFKELTAIFQATEYTERYLTQLGQFTELLPESAKLINGIKNQQSVVVNGVLKTLEQVEQKETLLQGYQALVETLTRPELLPVLTQLATKVYGPESVALKQPVVTPIQTNPNPTDAVVRESVNQYRVIKIENDRLSHILVTDSRGLSAADYLNQTTVVQVQSPSAS